MNTHHLQSIAPLPRCLQLHDVVYLWQDLTTAGGNAEIIGAWSIKTLTDQPTTNSQVVLSAISETKAGDKFGEDYELTTAAKNLITHQDFVEICQEWSGTLQQHLRPESAILKAQDHANQFCDSFFTKLCDPSLPLKSDERTQLRNQIFSLIVSTLANKYCAS